MCSARATLAAAVLAAGLLGTAAPAQAGAVDDFLRAATLSLSAGDAKAALEACREGLAMPDGDLATRAKLYASCGAAAWMRKKKKEATLAIRTALALDPTAAAPEGSSAAAAAAFDRERAWWSTHTPFGVTHVPPVPRAGEPPVLELGVADELGVVAGARVSWRREGDWQTTPVAPRAPGAATVSVTLPAEAALPAAGGLVEYYVVAVDAAGGPLAAVGSAEEPRTLVLAPPKPPPASKPAFLPEASGDDEDVLDDEPAPAKSHPKRAEKHAKRRADAGGGGAGGGHGPRWAVWLGIGGGALAAGAVAVALVLFLSARTATLDVGFVVEP